MQCDHERENDTDDTDNDAAPEESSNEEAPATEQRRGRLLKDEDGFCVIDANKINELLDVNKYIEAWPLIPKAVSYTHLTLPTSAIV